MKAPLHGLWVSRSPRERQLLKFGAAALGVLLYLVLVVSLEQARGPLRESVGTLRSQAARLDQQAVELVQLRSAPAPSASTTDLRALVQSRLDGTGLSRGLARLDAPDIDHVVVVFGAVAFSDWLEWTQGLQSLQVRLESCRVEALSTPGLVSVTATLVRAKPP